MVVNPILNKRELRRLPFQRRPIAEPGTRLVFQMADGQLIDPEYPLTTGDVWWRRPQTVFAVDTRLHSASFETALPCRGDALHFDAMITFAWIVHVPVTVVREQVEDPEKDCRSYLDQQLRVVSRQHDASEPHAAEQAIRDLGQTPIEISDRGLRIAKLGATLKLHPEQAVLAKELEISSLRDQLALKNQSANFERQQLSAAFYEKFATAGSASLAGLMFAQDDPSKVTQAADFMVRLWQRDQEVALQAMKVIADSDQLRIGELDGAVLAAVESFKKMVTQAGAKFDTDALEAPGAAAITDGSARPGDVGKSGSDDQRT